MPLPDPNIPGYTFPETEETLLGWVGNQPADTNAIYLHGWGLWASLTAPSGQTAYGIDNAPVYLTWKTKQDLQALSSSTALAETGGESAALSLGPISQLLKFGVDTADEETAPALESAAPAGAIQPDTGSLESVAYSPDATQHILENDLFQLSAIQSLYDQGKTETPAFPVTAVSVKPVYKIISGSKLIDGRYYAMPAWPGTPPVTPDIETGGFDEPDWPGCVYVDTQNTGSSSASGIDPACGGPTSASTYGLGDFVTYPVTSENYQSFDAEKLNVGPGDFLILMAMHVTSREMTEWTWQTFFWTPDPANPPLPSGSDVAAARPAELSGPAAHYAMSLAYQMISPNQPVTGGDNSGVPMIAYNPYLEAGFNNGISTPPNGMTRPVTNPENGDVFVGTVGVQTNCMTCHALAAVPFGNAKATPYGTDFYISRDDPIFTGTVQTDFLWSIADIVKNQQ